jgi:hypothetical protein
MKQKKFNSLQSYVLKTGILSLFLFVILVHSNAQTSVIWTTNSPSLSASNIGILCDDLSLDIRFRINTSNETAEALLPKSIRVALPAGVCVIEAIGSVGVSGGTINPGLPFSSGTAEFTIPISSMSYNTEVYLILKLRADDCSVTPSSSTLLLSVLSNGISISDRQTSSLSVVKPDISASPVNANPVQVPTNTNVLYEIPLSIANTGVGVRSMKIIIRKDRFTSLSDVRLGSTPIVPAIVTETAVTLELTNEIIGAIPISAVAPQILSFQAKASVNGLHSISADVDFPLTSGNVCVTKTNLFTVNLSYPSGTGMGTVILSREGVDYTFSNPKTGEYMPAAFDLLHVNYAYISSLRNTGTAPLVKLRILLSETQYKYYRWDSYIDENAPIYYSITPNLTVTQSDVRELNKTESNCVYSDPLEKKMDLRLLLDEFTGKPSAVEFDILEPVPPGYYLKVFIPKILGQTFDSSNWTDMPVIYETTSPDNISGHIALQCIAESSWDINGNTPTVSQYAYGGRYYHPVFSTPTLADFALRAGEQTTAIIPFKIRAEASGHAHYFYIQLPLWLELDGTPQLAGNFSSSQTLLVNGDTYFDSGFNTYKLVMRNAGEYKANLKIPYRAKTSGEYTYGSASVVGNIRYWVDWDTGYGVADNPSTAIDEKAIRPIITYITKHSHGVVCNVISSGVRTDNFSLKRITRGLAVKGADAVNGRTPGDSIPGGAAPQAADADIEHHVYLPGDTGRVEITATILNSGYKYMGVLLSSEYLPYFDFASFPATQSTVRISGTDYFANDIRVCGDSVCISFPCPSGDFSAATAVLSIPFKADTTVARGLKSLQAEVYMATAVPVDPLNPGTLREGADIARENWCIYPPHYTNC